MTNATVPRTARVVVVGGGVAGCSTAYHLAKRGWADVVLIERRKLTSGTTWHAAGLITTARPTFGTREIVQRSLRVFQSLEHETGFSPGFERTGTLHLADDEARWAELRRAASAAHGNGIRAELVTPDEAVKLFPPLYAGDLLGAVHYPDDGRGNATDTTMALAAGARQLGVTILENTTVTGVRHARQRGDRGQHHRGRHRGRVRGQRDRHVGPRVRRAGSASGSRCRRWPTTTSSPSRSRACRPACPRSRPPRNTPT